MGDRPCRPHKLHGVICEDCAYFEPTDERILIVKLGASGDVLRTVPMVASLLDLHPKAHCTWLSGEASYSLVCNQPHIDRALCLSPESMAILDSERFDLCVNFDLSPEAAAIAMRVRAATKLGFGRDERGSVIALNPEAEEWLAMSLWDDRKKANTLTYQTHMRRILRAPEINHPISMPLPREAVENALRFAADQGLTSRSGPLIGFNVGAGERWQHKKWTVEGFTALAERIHSDSGGRVMVLYGPDDQSRAQEVMAAFKTPYIDAGARPSMMQFAAILDLCDLVVTGDTFALHAALALGKSVVCLVGPTSAQELELYGQGDVLQGEIDCLGCYLTRCDKEPHCMKLLSADTVYHAVVRLLKDRHAPTSS